MIRNIAKVSIMTATLLVTACSSDNRMAADSASGAGGSGTAGTGGTALFVPPVDPGPGGILFAASGEVLALTGYAFPPADSMDAAFVDGWQVDFKHLIVTIDHLSLSENSDVSAGDQSQTGRLVAEVDGPWAVDLSHSDPNNLPGKGGPGEQAVPIAALSDQNKNGGEPFATDGTRYAFGFETVAAQANALNVNLDAEAQAAYEAMAKDGCAVTYIGTATFKGGTVPGHKDCNIHPDWPKTVNFNLCFKSPSTYVNCQNPDNGSATPLGRDEFQRGIAFQNSGSVIGQVTIHTDHPFWDSVLHDSPTHFDQFAARVSDQPGTPTVTLEMTQGVDYTAYTDAAGAALSWRYCIDPPIDVHPQFTGAMSFDPQSVPHASSSSPTDGLRDYYDFATYNQSTQGHLNSDGLCFVKHRYPSPN